MDEVLKDVAFLRYEEILRYFRENRQYKNIEKSPKFWKFLIKRDYNISARLKRTSWKKYYEEIHFLNHSFIYFIASFPYNGEEESAMDLYSFLVGKMQSNLVKETSKPFVILEESVTYKIEGIIVNFYFPVQPLANICMNDFHEFFALWKNKLAKEKSKRDKYYLGYGNNPRYEFHYVS